MATNSSRSSRPRRKRRARSAALPAQLQHVNLNAAGIDIGATSHWVAVPPDRDPQPVREFGAMTADLHGLADWLAACGIETVAMESTGVYWIPLFELLEDRGFDVHLVDPRQLKHVPGRKSDVLDCQWLQQLHTYGLLAGAFRPPNAICVLRAYVRQRARLVEYAGHHIQHMQKALTQMNVKLQHVVSDIAGVTGLRIIDALLAGERDPVQLATLRDVRCQQDAATLAQALEGHWREEHLFELQQARELLAVYHEKIAACDQHIEGCLGLCSDRTRGQALPPARRARKGRRNEPATDLRPAVFRVAGVDVTRIEGIDTPTALKVLSETGVDMTRWPTSKHFVSWLGLCPGSWKSGGTQLRSRSKPSANRAAAALRLAAQTLHHSQSALGAFFRRMKARLGAPKAITATAHRLARILYAMLRQGTAYVALGAAEYEQRYRERAAAALKRRARDLGYTLVEMPRGQHDPARA